MSCQVTSSSSSSVPELGYALVERRLDRVVVPDVGLGGHDAPVKRLDLLDRLGQVLRCRHRVRHRANLRAQVDGDDVRALLGQPDRVRPALTARGPGDEGDLARYSSCHVLPLFPLGGSYLMVLPASTVNSRPVT
jgi:hypothetical protein